MSKPKTPLLSLGARGSLGDAITYQKRKRSTIVREKPVPSYTYTLPQAYQRWLYEDYSYLWTQQSQAIKRQYAATGSRYHLTGFQYWMKYQLTHLPDIVAWWKLDDTGDTTTPDSSRNNNPATIYGASPALGIISSCRNFDGLNDYLEVPYNPIFDLTTTFTFTAFVNYTPGVRPYPTIIGKPPAFYTNYHFHIRDSDLHLGLVWRNPSGFASHYSTSPVLTNQWCHCTAIYNGTHILFYIAGQFINSVPKASSPTAETGVLRLAYHTGVSELFVGRIDDVRIYNRVLDSTEILRQSQRRYPP